ncbi:hypothetical protein EOM09_06945 [bacterium]|nr:hypothetical protein [bacterium]
MESLKLQLKKLKDNYDVMVSFPKIQEEIQIEMGKIGDDILKKEKELKLKTTSELLSKTLLEKVESL